MGNFCLVPPKIIAQLNCLSTKEKITLRPPFHSDIIRPQKLSFRWCTFHRDNHKKWKLIKVCNVLLLTYHFAPRTPSVHHEGKFLHYSIQENHNPLPATTFVNDLWDSLPGPFRHSLETNKAALLAFKRAISSDPYFRLANWNESTYLCHFTGVRCDQRHLNRSVVGLNLDDCDLVGTL